MMALARANASSERMGRNGNRRFSARNRRDSTAAAPPSSFLPVATVVFPVGHDPIDVDFALVEDDDGQSELVAADVEYHESPHQVGLRIVVAEVGEARPG